MQAFTPECLKKNPVPDRRPSGKQRPQRPASQSDPATGSITSKPCRILCAHCGQAITHSRERCTINGESEHRCLNPAGIYFHIQCYLTAPGCMQLGPSTSEHCWFAGYHWQLAYCSQCQTHLGWHYDGHLPNFFGLIRNRLIPESLDSGEQ